MTKLLFVAPRHIAVWWERCLSLLAPAVETSRGKYTTEDIYEQLLKQAMQLWIGLDNDKIVALSITNIIDYPSRRVCQMICGTGDDKKVLEALMAGIIIWAKDNKCSDMELIARPGWERALKDYEFKKTHVILNKAI